MPYETLSEKDILIIKSHGISPEDINSQLEKFRSGIPYSELEKPATLRSGIMDLDKFDKDELSALFKRAADRGRLTKFVPASGAATRMFKDLISYYNDPDSEIPESVKFTLRNIRKFPFFEDLKKSMENSGLNTEDIINSEGWITILDFLLFDKGINYSNLPKALLKFTAGSTALEEHFKEGIMYTSGKDQSINIHFTVSEEHEYQAEKLADKLSGKFLSEAEFNITFSNQSHATDTIAVDENNEPFRDKNNDIVLRPGGHGALIHNLNSISGDIVFIKNIDNVQRNDKDLSIYKKLLAGILIKFQNSIFSYIGTLRKDDPNNMSEIEDFVINELNISLSEEYFNSGLDAKKVILFTILIRPIRICGMVKNTGAPGGGPFFVKKNNKVSLQIVESSQIDLSNKDQKKIFESSTHFNPVDIVCGLRDCDGDNFNLLNYIGHETYFISNKSVDGKPLKALELPGLWNGAMADWNTVFVEVPLETFTPVKTVNDLL